MSHTLPDGIPRPSDSLHDFDYALEFDRPYVFDPADGNLLVEMAASSDQLDVPLWRDFHTTSPGQTRLRFFTNHLDPDEAVGQATGVSVARFTIVPSLQAGDADQDLDFDQVDLVQVQIAGRYLSGEAAPWGEGDWNGAPGGHPGNPPAGDGLFNQLDIVAAQQAATYLAGPYASVRSNRQTSGSQTSVVYNSGAGELAVDAAVEIELTSINIDSIAVVLADEAARHFGGIFDNDGDGDLTVIGSLAGRSDLGEVDLVYVPEPSASLLLIMGAAIGLLRFRTSYGQS